jgi:hypothetical protein
MRTMNEVHVSEVPLQLCLSLHLYHGASDTALRLVIANPLFDECLGSLAMTVKSVGSSNH